MCESFWFSPHQSTEIMKKTAAGGHLTVIFIAMVFPDFEGSGALVFAQAVNF
jgi:hypothetical protein